MSQPPDEKAKRKWSSSFCTVLQRELDLVGEGIEEPDAEPARPENLEDQLTRAHRKQLVGLALSGGGIRSATFNLGVLQALAQMKLLSQFHYLSTVSGGGYIGSWLMAWIKRRGLPDVESALSPEWVKQPGRSEPEEIRFLRRFSNYLTPKLGWLGADTWTVVATYVRNLILNLIVLIATMTVLLLLPRLVALLGVGLWPRLNYWWWAAIAIAAVTLAMLMITASLRFFRRSQDLAREPGVAKEEFEKRQMLSLLADEQKAHWRDAAGDEIKSFAGALPNSDLWFDRDFDDFVLIAKFRLDSTAASAIRIWQKRITANGQKTVAGGHVIYLGQSQFDLAGAVPKRSVHGPGAIDTTEPSAVAALRQDENVLEIACVKEDITVAINGQTINRCRVDADDSPVRAKAKPGVIGVQKSHGVEFTELNVRELPSPLESGGTQGQIQRLIVLPLFVAAFLGTFAFHFGDVPPILPWSWNRCAFTAAAISGGLVLLARLTMVVVEWIRTFAAGGEFRTFSKRFFGGIVREALCQAGASLIGGYCVRGLYEIFKGRTLWEVTAWGTPALIGLSLFVLTLHIGFLGGGLPDQVREWWSRLGAWLLIYSLVWVALFGTAFYAAPIFDFANSLIASAGWMACAGWLASTIWGVFAARGGAAGGPEGGGKISGFVAQVAPYVFIVGLFFFLSWGIDLLMPLVAAPKHLPPEISSTSFPVVLRHHWLRMDATNTWFSVGALVIGAVLVTAVFSWRLDINQFSLHLLYRNRLGRCYLGATNRFRRAQPFTGFAVADDFDLWELDDLIETPPDGKGKPHMTAPYLIINAALNLVGGKELAWQQRKAASFIFTQKFCGYDFPELPPGYSSTQQYAASSSRISLATAMAISGAAASPNMGYHTSPASAFLMTVFNVRLGWWLGNPRQEGAYMRSSPSNVLLSLMSELFGLTSEQGQFVYLSDGGHFENLGLYELVRRRCRFIVACDAEEDHAFGFGGLGNAIEKCRADLGIDIEIDVEPIRHRSDKGYSNWHCAIGQIHYSRVDPEGRDGMLVYLKSSLTGDEPTDVLRYAAENREFPHQSTIDQWFSESQFESYRALGHHITREVFGAEAAAGLSRRTTEELFVNLAQRWYPPSVATGESFTRHAQAVARIYEKLRSEPKLAFLSEQIYPEWRVLFAETGSLISRWRADQRSKLPKSLRDRLPRTAGELRAGFYICNAVIQVMEDVYLDLKLEDESDHPDNRGWMNFFKHWSWAPMFRVAWTISASNYGARFQSFCEEQLNLKIGSTKAEPIPIVEKTLESNLSDETKRIAGALATTIARWLIRKLPLDAETCNVAMARAADEPALEDPASEPEALEMAGAAIRDALKTRLNQVAIPKAPATPDAEWIAAAILLGMIRRGVARRTRESYAAQVAESIVFHAASMAQRFPAQELRKTLNVTERGLIELFFLYNPKLILRSEIVHFYLVPDCSPANRRGGERSAAGDLSFPFGFAILAKMNGEEKMVYFRVQDHLRSMGLASQALEKVIGSKSAKGKSLTAQRFEMHPEAHEIPTIEDQRRFERLFDSAKTAVWQKKARDPRPDLTF